MLSRLVCGKPLLTASFCKTFIRNVPKQQQQNIRNFAREVKGVQRGQNTRSEMSLKEKLMGPPTTNAYSIGKGALAGGAALGVGALCFYGIGLGSGVSTLENSHLWPEYVKTRIQDTYMYFGSSLAITAASAAAVFRSPTLLNLVARSGWISLIATFAVMIGSGMVAQSIPYQPGFGYKQVAWAVHSGIIGAVIAPLCFVGGPILIRAAWYTAGVVAGLSSIAICAPSDKFLMMGGPLAMGLGVVFASSLASFMLPPTTLIGAGVFSISLYGGLLLFSGFLLYDTQKIIKKAEHHPLYAAQPFDPVNSAISIYMDTINIFIRIVSILSGGGGNRR